jgi:hypothetical protein
MPPQSNSLPADIAAQIVNHPKCKILSDRTQYRGCHILLPEESERVSAIEVNGKFYVFSRFLREQPKVLQLAARLVFRGREVVITKAAGGAALWVYEPDAIVKPKGNPPSPQPERSFEVLESEEDYPSCEVWVPDVNQPLMALKIRQQYYCLLRTVPDERKAFELAERLTKKKNPTVITKRDRTWAVWVLEPDASLEP